MLPTYSRTCSALTHDTLGSNNNRAGAAGLADNVATEQMKLPVLAQKKEATTGHVENTPIKLPSVPDPQTSRNGSKTASGASLASNGTQKSTKTSNGSVQLPNVASTLAQGQLPRASSRATSRTTLMQSQSKLPELVTASRSCLVSKSRFTSIQSLVASSQETIKSLPDRRDAPSIEPQQRTRPKTASGRLTSRDDPSAPKSIGGIGSSLKRTNSKTSTSKTSIRFNAELPAHQESMQDVQENMGSTSVLKRSKSRTAMKPPLLPRIDGELREAAAENSKEVNMLVSGVSVVMNASKESRRPKASVPQKAAVAVESDIDIALQKETTKTAESSIPLKQEASPAERSDTTAASIIPMKEEVAIPVKENLLQTEPVTSAEIIVPLKEEGTILVEVGPASQIEPATPATAAAPLEYEASGLTGSSAPLRQESATRTENAEAVVTIPAESHTASQAQPTEPTILADATTCLKEDAAIPAESVAPLSETVIPVELSPTGVMASTESETPAKNEAEVANVVVEVATALVESGNDTSLQSPGQENAEAVAPEPERQPTHQIQTDSAQVDQTGPVTENILMKDAVDAHISEMGPVQTLESIALADKSETANAASDVPTDDVPFQEVGVSPTRNPPDNRNENEPTATLPSHEAQLSSPKDAEIKDVSNPADAGTIPSQPESKRDLDSVSVELAIENHIAVGSLDDAGQEKLQDAAVVAPVQEHTNHKEEITESSNEEVPSNNAVAESVFLQANAVVSPNSEHENLETPADAPSDQQAHPLTSQQVSAESTVKEVGEAKVQEGFDNATVPITNNAEGSGGTVDALSGATVDALSGERDREGTTVFANTKGISESVTTIVDAVDSSPPSSDIESKIEETACVMLAADLKEQVSSQIEVLDTSSAEPSATTLESLNSAKVNHIPHASDPIGQTMTRASSVETIEANPETFERKASIPELKSEDADSDGAQKSPIQEPPTETEVYVNVGAEAGARVPEE
ncbi:hypothetical protein BJ741DRAFT_601709 [Chytriomyces cf. hyalinus JEL632]|nr:hypothetical protein BJ741DRAFT_601709 [Chytriomyces cf. hyalinus JEL632]